MQQRLSTWDAESIDKRHALLTVLAQDIWKVNPTPIY
jgi:hypothetical protein